MNTLSINRSAGVLAHITSLPAENGNHGRLNVDAFRFVDWLAEVGFSIWQILPVGPTHDDGSPYLSLSAFAGNTDLIDYETLLYDNSLSSTWLPRLLDSVKDYTPFSFAEQLSTAGSDFSFSTLPDAEAYLTDNEYWLRQYAQFMTIKHLQNGKPWWEWPEPLRVRDKQAVREVLNGHTHYYRAIVIQQYLFERQWHSLKAYANKKGISLFGDMPLYVSHDSSDAWANHQFFAIDEQGQITAQAGVPPDMFSDTGQVWGNPVFNWAALEADQFGWWVERIQRQLSHFDILRIDHFRALQAYWEIPAGDKTAINGKWIEAPGDALLSQLRSTLGGLPLVAEDLGYITEEVHALRDAFHLPGMRILQFAFDGHEDNPHLPALYEENTLAYTGTHDNDTVLSWFEDLHPDAQQFILQKLECSDATNILDAMVQAVMHSPAILSIIPMQDILGLGKGNRMNMPGTNQGNWSWRFEWHQLSPEIHDDYLKLLKESGRHRINAF